MKIYDVSQSIPDCEIYPGDPGPEIKRLSSIDCGDLYNLTSFSMCAHNGTHIDAPFHFIKNGKTVDNIPLFKTVGVALVVECNGKIDSNKALKIISGFKTVSNETIRKILLKGACVVTEDGARSFVDEGIHLIGSETQSVGDEKAPMAVHKILLEKEVVLLEGIRLENVNEGVYFLVAAPISISGSDGAPCRAILIEFDGE